MFMYTCTFILIVYPLYTYVLSCSLFYMSVTEQDYATLSPVISYFFPPCQCYSVSQCVCMYNYTYKHAECYKIADSMSTLCTCVFQNAEKAKALTAAVKAHSDYTMEVCRCHGCYTSTHCCGTPIGHLWTGSRQASVRLENTSL